MGTIKTIEDESEYIRACGVGYTSLVGLRRTISHPAISGLTA
jgi:hypothetical protein